MVARVSLQVDWDVAHGAAVPVKFHADGYLDAQLKVGDFRARGHADGWLDVTYRPTGTTYGAGLHFDGDVQVYDGVITHDWRTLGSASADFGLSGSTLKLETPWKDFSLSL